MNMKKCNNPNCIHGDIYLPLEKFNKNKSLPDGLSNRCKDCVKKSVKQSMYKKKDYYFAYIKEKSKEWRIDNPEKYKERRDKANKEYQEKGYWASYYQKNREKAFEYSKRPEVIEKRNIRWRWRYENDVDFRVKTIMRANFALFFKDKGVNKDLCFSKTVNYSFAELEKHLEDNFRTGMTWNNIGEKWEIHHIKPLNLYDPKILTEVKECWSLDNLIPLWKTTEISLEMGDYIKGNRDISKQEIYDPRDYQ